MACWLQPVAGDETGVYFYALARAYRAAGTPPAKVTIDLVGDQDPVAIEFARANGCDAGG
jgi:hypothetical protein